MQVKHILSFGCPIVLLCCCTVAAQEGRQVTSHLLSFDKCIPDRFVAEAFKGGKARVDVLAGGENGRLLGTIYADNPTDSIEWYCRRNDFFRFDAPLDDVTDLCLILRPEKGAELWIDHFRFFPEPSAT